MAQPPNCPLNFILPPFSQVHDPRTYSPSIASDLFTII